jgi:hypothetical protein
MKKIVILLMLVAFCAELALGQWVVTSGTPNTATLYTNGSVGIGTTAPGSPLEVKGGNLYNGTIRVNTTSAGQYSSYAMLENIVVFSSGTFQFDAICQCERCR